MVLMLIERGYPLDEVVFYDTGKEFQAIYYLRDKVKPLLESKGIVFTELKPKNLFDYMMFEHKTKSGKTGYGWCGATCRWGTSLKIQAIDSYVKNNIGYIGIAADETERLKKERKLNKTFPLAELGMTERDCLDYCYSQGFNWLEKTDSIYSVPEYIDLYDILDRVSCWCCRKKNLKELKAVYYYFTNSYWQNLKDIQARLPSPMKPGGSVFELEKRFIRELETNYIDFLTHHNKRESKKKECRNTLLLLS